ncbi:MAG: alpha-amylase family glycosyl hydrolase [Pseudomonadota bacterium]
MQVTHPDWSRDAVIYQLNTRQFTAEGTFAAAEEHLPRIAALGVDIVWLMPIHPIGEMNRKGSLGSPYAVKDFRAVNPEFGTLDNLKSFIDTAHSLDMKVILDWVANHSAWDNRLTISNPDWYERNWKGEFRPPLGTDWGDVIDFNYDNPDMRQYMTEAMVYWVHDVGVDGFRADVAGYVPLDFWETLRVELDKVKPVFMLAEWETPDLHRHAFSATYAWGWKEAMQPIARGEAKVGALRGYIYGQQNTWPHDAYRLVFSSNHDQNSWDGTASEIYGDALEAVIALAFITEGIPMIYNGQEAGLDHQLAFFEKDEIIWRNHPHAELFTTLAELKSETRALWNGNAGARMIEVQTNHPDEVFAFVRRGEEDGVFAVFNLSDTPLRIAFEDDLHAGDYTHVMSGEAQSWTQGEALSLGPWGYAIYRQDLENE